MTPVEQPARSNWCVRHGLILIKAWSGLPMRINGSIRHRNISQLVECRPRDARNRQFLLRPGVWVANESKPGRNFPKDKRGQTQTPGKRDIVTVQQWRFRRHPRQAAGASGQKMKIFAPETTCLSRRNFAKAECVSNRMLKPDI